jgi:hypothetical protein
MPLARHIVFATYGTWLPGDSRGHWSPLLEFYGRVAAAGHRLNLPDPCTERRAAEAMKEPERRLTPADIRCVADTIGRIVSGETVGNYTPPRPGRLFTAHAAAIERTHVHLLVGVLDFPLDRVIGWIKGVSSSQVLKLPHNVGCRRTWATGYWHVDLYDTWAVAYAQRYIVDHNRRRGLPEHPYTWLTPYPIDVASRNIVAASEV